MTCPALATGDAFLSSLLRHIDCQGRTLGETGYQALSQPGSPISLTLTSLLVIFIALFGLRLALTGRATLDDAVSAIVKIGIVVTLATSWPAYKTVVYDVVVEGPGQLSRMIAAPSRLAGADGGLIPRLQSADRSIVRLTNWGSGRDGAQASPDEARGEPAARFPVADDTAFGWARVFFLAGAVASFAVVRLTAGILLALAPLIAGLILFDISRPLVVGWARALAYVMFASTATAVILGVQISLMEPWLARMIALRQAQGPAASAPLELMVVCMVFALTLVGALGILLKVSFMPAVSPHFETLGAAASQAVSKLFPERMPAAASPTEAILGPPRALAVASALHAAQRREVLVRSNQTPQASASPTAYRTDPSDLAIPSASTTARPARPRKSLAAALRDSRS